jgi:hypothetical protein
MKKIFTQFVMSAVLLFSLTATTPALAAGPLGGALGKLDSAVGGGRTGLNSSLTDIVGTVINAVLATVGTIFLVLTIYAGILWMTASGNEEQVEKAKNIIKAAVIGLFVTMSAYAITSFIGNRLNGTTSSGGGSGGGGGGGGAAAPSGLSDTECKAQGATCDFVSNVGADCTGNSGYASSLGACTPDTSATAAHDRVCCVPKDGTARCALVPGASCQATPCGTVTTNGVSVTTVSTGFECTGTTFSSSYCCVPR